MKVQQQYSASVCHRADQAIFAEKNKRKPKRWADIQTAFLEQLLPVYKQLSGVGFHIGLIESFLYGAFAGLVYVPVYNFLNRNFATRGFR